MPVPDIIEQILTKNDLDIGTIEAHPSAISHGATQTTLLQDSEGQLQAIYSADSILDIDAVNRLTGRELIASPQPIIDALCSKAQLERLPTIPHALELNVLIDQQLLEANELQLDTGSKQHSLTLSKAQFRQLLGSARSGAIAVATAKLSSSPLDSAGDIEQISAAIANFTQLRIKQRLEETLDFPPLPTTAQEIIKLRADPNADIHDLSTIVENDPPLAAQVVSWAASPYYAAPGNIKSVHDAIVRVLGFDLVLNLSLGLSLGKTLALPKSGVRGFSPYWQQAVYAATAVEALVATISPKERPTMGMAYLAGLLHNFGYLILAEVFPPHFASYCRYQEANPYANHCYIERHLLGVTREQLAAWLMRSWNMPEPVCTALRYQNDADYDDEDSAYANLLFVAMRLLRRHGIGDAPLEAIPDALFERLYLDPDKASAAIDAMLNATEELNVMAGNMAA